MSETFIKFNLSPRGPDESGEWRASVVAVDLNLIRWLADLATKWLSCARKHTRKKIQTPKPARFIHFMRFNRFAIRAISFFRVKFNVSLVRQWIFP